MMKIFVSYSHKNSGWCIYVKLDDQRSNQIGGPFVTEAEAYTAMHSMGREN